MNATKSPYFVLKPCVIAVAATLMTLNVNAQTTPVAPAVPAVKIEKIEVTGSSIKRIEGESALPVETITREDIDKAGVTTAAELLQKITSNVGGLTDGADQEAGQDDGEDHHQGRAKGPCELSSHSGIE